jgi:hypothetical protein
LSIPSQVATAINGANQTTNNVGGVYIGANRDISATAGASGQTTGNSNAAFALSVLDLANTSTSAGTIYVQWNGITGVNKDLTSVGTNFGIYMALPTPVDNGLDVTFTATGAAGTAVISRNFPSGITGDSFFFKFTDGTNPGVWASVDTLRATFTGPTAWDAQVSLLETREAPIPGTILLMGAGLLGLARRAKRA